MNRKVIKSILRKKFNDWTKTIEDEKVRKLVEDNSIITGGCIASMLLGEKINDFDVYFTNKATTLAVAKYYVEMFNKANPKFNARVLDGEEECKDSVVTGRHNANMTKNDVKIFIQSLGVAADEDYEEIIEQPFDSVIDVLDEADSTHEDTLKDKQKYKPVFLSSNAITLSDKIQIVTRFHGEPDEIHSNYDFVHCTNYWTSGNNELVLHEEALESLLTKTLIYQGSKYPLCSVIRTRKFIKRGFHINAGQYLKMMFQISELNLSDVDVLEDQLVGVDSAYFGMLIRSLQTKQENDPEFKLTGSYLASIIDKIF